MTPTNAQLLSQLMGVRCACGGIKTSKMSFCSPCYRALPTSQKNALYRRIGMGYAEAFSAAVETLRARGRVPPAEAT